MTSAQVEVLDDNSQRHNCRILLDTCATSNFITDKFLKQLGVQKQKFRSQVGAMDDMTTTSNYKATITFKSIHGNFTKSLQFLSVSKITDFVPQDFISRESIQIPSNIKLADPDFHQPAPVDMLIGSGPSLSMFCIGQIKTSAGGREIFLQKTRLG